MPFDPWQEWAAIHLGELLPDGRPRFRKVLILVARQNGKTTLAFALILFWMFMEDRPLTLITSTDRSYAKRAWSKLCEMASSNEWLSEKLGPSAIRLTISEESLKTLAGAELIFAANNRRAGRSTTLDRWVADELREHRDDEAWSSANGAMNAVLGAQVVAISNQGDDSSVMLDALRDPAIEFIETGEGDRRLGLFEWSAPAGCDPTDPAALALANPNYARRIDPDSLRGDALRAKRAGGVELASFRTEVLCQRIALLDPAIDPDLWHAAAAVKPVDLAEHRDHVALCLDVSIAGDHASLVAAAVVDGVAHVDVVAAWSGFGCLKAVRADLPGLVAKVKPRVLGWFPAGPAAVLAADMQEKRARGWPPRRVTLEALTTEAASVCMGLAELVKAGEVAHPADPMLNAHVESAQKLGRGDAWVFVRRGTGAVDAAYALAGAVHLARTLPPARTPLAAL